MTTDAERLEIETTVEPDDIQFLDGRLYEFNVAATGIQDEQLLGIFVRDASDTIEAGLSGWTWATAAGSRNSGCAKIYAAEAWDGASCAPPSGRLPAAAAARSRSTATAFRRRSSTGDSATSNGPCWKATRVRTGSII